MSATLPENKPLAIGLIVPSSNTVVEPAAAGIAATAGRLRLHYTRIPVTRIANDSAADAQFDGSTMSAAAALLGHADVDVVAWAGTSGSWLGLDHDSELMRCMSKAAGVPATTSTVALMEACRQIGVSRVGLVTPYTGDVVSRIEAVYAKHGIAVTAGRHFSLTDNRSFASVPEGEISRAVRDVGAEGVDAVLVVCTNLAGAAAALTIGDSLSVPILDSVAVTLWQAGALVGLSVGGGFGRLSVRPSEANDDVGYHEGSAS